MKLDTYPQITPSIEATLKSRYGLTSENDWPNETNQLLASRVIQEAAKLNLPIINQIPSQFDHQNPDQIEAIPQYCFPAWKTLNDNLDFFDIKGGALYLQPAAWQFGWAFHRICRQYKLYAAYGDAFNLPMTVEIIRQAKLTCVVTNEMVAKDFKRELETKEISNIIDLAIIARDVRKPSDTPAEFNINGATTLWEIQIFPGHTIAYQAFGLAGNKNAFHLSEDYLWRFEEEATYITGISPLVLPVLNYQLPVKVRLTESKTKLPAYSFIYA